mgnify:CR=1
MKKYTFEELVRNDSVTFEPYDNTRFLDIKDVLDLLKQVRQATLQEAANKADADFEIMGLNKNDINATVEVYVLKHSILDLDKDSIEVDE